MVGFRIFFLICYAAHRDQLSPRPLLEKIPSDEQLATLPSYPEQGVMVLEIACSKDLDAFQDGQAILRAINGGFTYLAVHLGSSLDFIDSIHLATLLAGKKRAMTLEGDLRIVAENVQARQILTATMVNRIIGVYASLEELYVGQPRL